MTDAERNGWAEVVAEFEYQMQVPPEWRLDAERRTRTTVQCQRLLPDRWVALAVPARRDPRPDTDDPRGNVVVVFTDRGPWLFSASPSNPGLPREAIAPIADAAPITFAPHDREGGVLIVGGRSFIVPYVYATSVREFVGQLAVIGPPDEEE